MQFTKDDKKIWYRLRDEYGIEFWWMHPMSNCEVLFVTTKWPFNPLDPV